jgi:phage-related protein
MALNVGSIVVDILTDNSGLNRGLNQAQSSVNRFATNAGKALKNVGSKMTTMVTAPIVAGFGGMIKLASDYEESINKVGVAFKDNAKDVQEWAKTSLKSFGIAEGTALDMAALYGDMGTSMGLTTKDASEMAMSLSGLAGDLASFKNIGIDQAMTALNGVFTGESEALKGLGIPMLVEDLEQMAKAQGKSWKEMSQAEKVALRYQFVLSKTKNAQGDFARTSDGAANQMRIFTEGLKEAGQQLGSIVLPLFTDIITKVNEWLDKFKAISPETQILILKILALVAAIGPFLWIVGQILTMIPIATAVIGGLGTVFGILLGPVGLIVLAIAGFIGAVVYLWKTNEGFRNAIISAWESIKETAIEVWGFIKEELASLIEVVGPAMDRFLKFITSIWNTYGNDIVKSVSTMWKSIVTIFKSTITILSGIIKFFVALFSGDFEGLKKATIQIVNGISTFVSAWGTVFKGIIKGVWTGIKVIWSTSLATISNVLTAIFTGIYNKVATTFERIKAKVVGVADKIKTALKNAFTFTIPKIKLPHFSIKGGFSLMPPKVPTLGVSWYKNGGILNQPTLIGAGEAGKEAVVPLSGMASQAIARELSNLISGNSGGNTTININGYQRSPSELADEVIKRMDNNVYRRKFSRG